MIGMTVGTNGMNAKVLVNDFHVKRVGGAPPYTLLLAVRHGFGRKDADPDLNMILLLRVCGRAAVPQDAEREKILDQYHLESFPNLPLAVPYSLGQVSGEVHAFSALC